jgi:HemY protein
MKWLLWLLAAFGVAAGLSLALRGNQGYALFSLHPWRVEVSLNFLAFVVIAAFVAAYALARVVLHALRLPAHVRAYRERRRQARGHAAVLEAIKALFEGRFVRAEKLASEARELGAAPGLASLIAARAAQRLREFGRRERWLERAEEDGDWRQARLMVSAELLLDERRFEEARRVLRELLASGPKHVAALTLLLRAERGLGNWDEVIRIAHSLEKHSAMPAEALDSILVNARIALLSGLALDPGALSRHWGGIPQSDRTHPDVAFAAARAFIRLGDCRKAHRIIEDALEREWSGALALLYSECTDGDALQRLQRAEAWLRARPAEAELLLTLGRLCVQRELWGKAQSYLEASLAVRPTQAAHIALAKLFERVGRIGDASRHFRASAEIGVAG